MNTSESRIEHRLVPFRLDQQLRQHHHQQLPALQYAEKRVDDAALDFGVGSMPEPEKRLTKLNPLAEEFVPACPLNPVVEEFLLPSQTNTGSTATSASSSSSQGRRQWRNRPDQLEREHARNRIAPAHVKEDRIRRTVHVSNIGCQVNEMQLSALFVGCGPIVDCRICRVLSDGYFRHFAFVEFTDLEGAHAALSLSGELLGYHGITVLRSKTGIVPVNPDFLPMSEDERTRCERTIYCTNIDSHEEANVQLFFQYHCGEIAQLRILKDSRRSTLVAFVEFVWPESAIIALNCSGAQLGARSIRVSPSKTPVWLAN